MIRIIIPIFSLGLGIILAVFVPVPVIDATIEKLPINFASLSAKASNDLAVVGEWPPVVGEKYPDLNLMDQNGELCKLSDFAGKVILVELAAVPCKGCQAFAGGKQYGGYGGVSVQGDLESIHHYANQYARVRLGQDRRVVFVQLMLYGIDMSSPTSDEVSGWAKHFNMDRDDNEIVLQGDRSMLSRATMNMIPGFHLIDKDFTLQGDSGGHRPSHDLYRELLPMLGELVK